MSARRLASLGALLLALPLAAHVGSPLVSFQGTAGAYPVRVVVRPPEVIPGQAEISVRVQGAGVRRVTVQPVFWAYPDGAPPPDEARPAGEAGLYSAPLWFMTAGSYSVRVGVEGSAGTGSVMVPVGPVARRILGMPRGLGWALAGLGAFLFLGALSIIGAAVRESQLPPGQAPDAGRRRRARWATAGTAVFLVLALTGAKAWWDSEDAAYRRSVYRPIAMQSAVATGPEGRVLDFRIADSLWRASPPTAFVPDHGKLMHLFLVREPGLDVFAHLHPQKVDSFTFRTPFPRSPPGATASTATWCTRAASRARWRTRWTWRRAPPRRG